MKKLILLVSLVCLIGGLPVMAGCAVLKAQKPQQIAIEALTAAEWGVKADHDFGKNWLSDADVAQFNKIDQIIRDVIASNPQTAIAAAKVAIASFEKNELAPDAKLRPYLDALLQVLP